MKNLLVLVFILIPFLGFCQKPVIEFEKTTHEFGEIDENGGNAVYDFVFKNTGTTPLILTNVRASCGCTTPTWTREPVAPNQTGSVKVSYNPKNRPGRFSKSITINSNAENMVVVLNIKGNVKSKPADPYAKFRFKIGNLKMLSSTINMGNVMNSAVVEKSFDIVNQGENPVTVQLKSVPAMITANITPATLKKGEQGKMTIKLDAAKANEWDFVSSKLTITTSEGASEDLVVTANIREDFSAQAAENYVNSPVAVFSKKEIDLGVLAPNSTTTNEFTIENTGKSNLIIRKIKTSDQDIIVSMPKTVIKPGKNAKVTVTFKVNEQTGNKIKVVTFTTNDPRNVHTSFRVFGEVK